MNKNRFIIKTSNIVEVYSLSIRAHCGPSVVFLRIIRIHNLLLAVLDSFLHCLVGAFPVLLEGGELEVLFPLLRRMESLSLLLI